MDARCGQVYNALFEIKKGFPISLCDDRAIAADALLTEITELFTQKRVILIGDGAELIDEKATSPNVFLPPASVRMQRASGVALAAQGISAQREPSPCAPGIDAAALMPVYLRPPQAERELKMKTAK